MGSMMSTCRTLRAQIALSPFWKSLSSLIWQLGYIFHFVTLSVKSKYLNGLNWPLSQQLMEWLTAIKLSASVWICDTITETQKKENMTWGPLSIALFWFVAASCLTLAQRTWERKCRGKHLPLSVSAQETINCIVDVGPLCQWIQSAWKCFQALTAGPGSRLRSC